MKQRQKTSARGCVQMWVQKRAPIHSFVFTDCGGLMRTQLLQGNWVSARPGRGGPLARCRIGGQAQPGL